MQKRYFEIDFLRGIAIIGMMIFHLFFILDFRGVVSFALYNGAWLSLARFVQITFIMLVGISMVISWKNRQSKLHQAKRGLLVLAMAALVTLGSYFIVPDYFVRFGILHMLGTSIIIFSPIVDKKWLALFLCPLIFFGTLFQAPLAEGLQVIGYMTGIDGWGKYSTVDYFPLIPWSSGVALGIFLGHILLEKKLLHKIEIKALSPITYLGKHSLLVYMIHVPIMLIVLRTLQII